MFFSSYTTIYDLLYMILYCHYFAIIIQNIGQNKKYWHTEMENNELLVLKIVRVIISIT